MPNIKTHIAISKKRTGKSYQRLHQWIDEGCKVLRHSHRVERHTPLSEYSKHIEKAFGKEGVIEWLIHIALDNLETANKLAAYIYRKPYAKMELQFKNRLIKDCVFEK